MKFPCLFTLVVSEALIMCAEKYILDSCRLINNNVRWRVSDALWNWWWSEITFVNGCNLTKSADFGSGDIPIWKATCSFLSLLIHYTFPFLLCSWLVTFFPVGDFQFLSDMGNALALVTLSPRNILEIMLQLQFFAILRCSNLISNLQLTEGLFQHTTRANLHHITLLQDLFFLLYLYHISVLRYTFPFETLVWVYIFVSGK